MNMISDSPRSPEPPRRLDGRTLVAIGVSVGIVAGLVELLLLTVERFALMRTILRSREVVWMSPLGYAITFGVLGLLLALVSHRRGGLRPTIGLGLPVFFAAYSVLLLYDRRMHPVAQLLIAIGCAVQAVRWTRGREAGLPAAARRWTARLMLLLALIAAGSLGGRWIRERRALATLPAVAPRAPNVLFIILDTVRALELSVYGFDRPTTPALSRLATTGTTFDYAVSSAPWTVLSHADLFTGELRAVHRADWYSRLDPAVPTLAAVFRRQGYRTGGFSANEVHAGWEFGFARDFIHFEDHDISLAELVDATTLWKFLSGRVRVRRLVDDWQMLGRTSADDVNAEVLHWLDQSGDRPYFVFLNYFDAHDPYLPPEPFAAQFGASRTPASLRARLRGFVYPTIKPQKARNAYDASIAYVDDRIGKLLDDLKRRGLLDNTLVVVTADHGELIGERKLWGHANSLYFPTLHVPLLLAMPGTVPADRRVTDAVTLRDVATTILDLAGVHSGPAFPGTSLARYWRETPAAPPTPIISEVTGLPNLGKRMPIGRGDMVSLVRDSLHYIRNGDGIEELYNFRRDETEDVPLGAEFAAELAAMRRFVDSVYVPGHGPPVR